MLGFNALFNRNNFYMCLGCVSLKEFDNEKSMPCGAQEGSAYVRFTCIKMNLFMWVRFHFNNYQFAGDEKVPGNNVFISDYKVYSFLIMFIYSYEYYLRGSIMKPTFFLLNFRLWDLTHVLFDSDLTGLFFFFF